MDGPYGKRGEVAHDAQIVCTLAEGRYFCGVAALANSLVEAGFAGTFVVGYRGQRPEWLAPLAWDEAANSYNLTPAVRLQLVEVPGGWHLNNCKPRFMEQALLEMYPRAEFIYYFDTDIVVRHPWQAFASWVQSGVVMALDATDSYMPPTHVYRLAWRALAAKQNRPHREVIGYVNGGCVGIARADIHFATVWHALMEELEREGADMCKMKNATGKLEFSRMDQDILNATIMATDTPIALLGSEAMGMFPWLGTVMPHAMWQRKPWDRNYIMDALRGFPPGRVHRAYWECVDGPIRPFSAAQLRRKRAQFAIGHAIGLLHMRSFRDT